MRFSELLVAAELADARRTGDAEVTDVSADSRRCRAGCCFVAVRGTAADGHRYIPAAVSAGAAAVVCEDSSAVPDGTPWAAVADTRAAAGRLAQAIRGWPARKLTCIAVTGTKGKSTVAVLTRAALEAAGMPAGLFGTIAHETGLRAVPAATTTPDAMELAEMTAEMVRAGKTHLVMEASSHALDQDRTAGLTFRVGVFTNLAGDHMDYHGTMEAYFLAKRRLFERLDRGATAVINRDAPRPEGLPRPPGELLAEATKAEVLWYGLSPAAELWARIDRIDSGGTDFAVRWGGRQEAVHVPLIGRYNVLNCLAAAGAAGAVGADLAAALRGIAGVGSIRGRLQRVPSAMPFDVFVDYAHTDDALRNVLGALRPLTKAHLIVAFGCGGDRDRTKRPRMARACEELADLVVVTSDNPRSEKPQAIIDEICAGFTPAGRDRALVEPDRRAAIELAVARAEAGDVVLIAGKGHEDYQIIGGRRTHFDDVEVASEALAARSGQR